MSEGREDDVTRLMEWQVDHVCRNEADAAVIGALMSEMLQTTNAIQSSARPAPPAVTFIWKVSDKVKAVDRPSAIVDRQTSIVESSRRRWPIDVRRWPIDDEAVIL